ncbi:MAG: Isoleucine--tRNA ligase [Microgenomates group bacterium ADurb.Bin219]|nr:MAG: Isoleucine--tRNA ligase [Microgenomates group bacterium ADurb.Bin219]
MFKPVDLKIDFPAMERRILDWWYSSGLVNKYLHRNDSSKKKFSFFDGPITANNPMGVHHAWGRTYKDLWQRYKNMNGFRQRFQNGFDNQGLWVEVEVEKEKGFRSKKEIEKYGIEKFVNDCRERTLKCAKEQTEQSKRLGYFMDWENSYYTLSEENNYMIWHFLKKCWQTDWQGGPGLYKGRDSVPWCPRCGTAISQHEILTEEYKELTHESVYFRLPLVDRENEYFLVWTTTPWTIPANVGLAVNPKLEYWLVEGEDKKRYWLVADLAKTVFGEKAKPVKKTKGNSLVGLKYLGPFDELLAVQEAKKEKPETFHTVLASEELVTATEGTGIVHLATGCGQEDFALGKENNLPVIAAIDESANYFENFGDLSGKNAKKDPDLILKHTLLKDFLFKITPYTHRYPTCWRCKTELVWRVVDEWYIAMDTVREKMMAITKKINWLPAWGKDQELDWLKNMHDWLISKKRYWGLALPIWECQCGYFEVIGSKEELKEKAVEGWKKFQGHTPHRPWIDEVKILCPKCGEKASRIKDVGNPWLDAGIISFSTLVAPETKKVSYLTDKKYWQEWYPADFITESFPGQFKNWFYSLLAMATVLENEAPFKNVLAYALVRDEKGEEMHKSKGNAIWFDDAAEKMGVDVMRWMYVLQNPEANLNFGFQVADEVRRRFHLMIWNVYNFFVTYANIAETQNLNFKTNNENLKLKSVLDKWIISKLNGLIKIVTEALDKYDPFLASHAIEEFVVNDLSAWYVRRSRDRVSPSSADRQDQEDCFRTLFLVLNNLVKILAPFTPFIAEEIYQNLATKKEGELKSVHLEGWPSPEENLIDLELEEKMVLARKICEMGHAARKSAGIKVRQPLSKLSIKNLPLNIDEVADLIKDELNVKELLGNIGKGELTVELDTEITAGLKEEGEARDIIRQIQEARKNVGCRLDEKVEVYFPNWPEKFTELIKKETLAIKIEKKETLEIIRNQ